MSDRPPSLQPLADRIEYIHAEHKGYREQQMNTNAAVDKRISRLEVLDEQKDTRLNGGAATFAKLEAQIEKVNGKIDWPWWKVLATLTPAVLLVLTWVWQAARYPDEEKFEALKNEVIQLKIQQITFDTKLNEIKSSQMHLNNKLDQVLGNRLP